MDGIVSIISKVNSAVNDVVWGWPVIILILGTGILLSIRTRFLQIGHFRDSIDETIKPTVKSLGKRGAKGRSRGVSQFEAFSAAISGTVGTGNIIGVTAAILTGGPGAVFWMWVCAFFGMVTNYSENVLGLYYREKDEEGNLSGGAFYYIRNGLKCKPLAYLAAVFCLLGAIGMSAVQTNKITDTLSTTIGPLFAAENLIWVRVGIGIVVAAVLAVIIIGGIKRIGKVASKLVPLMSLLFMALALISIFAHIGKIPAVFAMIFRYAFNFKAAGSGVFGYAFATVVKKGMARGVFSNEAGMGSSVIAHSASDTPEPVIQGLWGVFEVFFDTFVICTLTALMILTNVDVNALTGLEGDTATAMGVFSANYGTFGLVSFSVILPLFAFTTILAWSYYGEKATEFCFQWLGKNGSRISVLVFKIVYVLLVVCSTVIESDLVWSISDTANGLMSIPNLICLICMSGTVVRITKNYFDRRAGKAVEPMLNNDPKLNAEFAQDIQSK